MNEEFSHLSASDRARMLPAKKTQHQLQVGPSHYAHRIQLWPFCYCGLCMRCPYELLVHDDSDFKWQQAGYQGEFFNSRWSQNKLASVNVVCLMQVAVRGWIASMELYHEVYGDKVPEGHGIKGRQINQDSLENVFGCLRGQGGANDNPHAAQVGNHVQRLVMGREASVKKSNVRLQ